MMQSVQSWGGAACIPTVVESCGSWGTEARQALSQLASLLAV